jgi:hypothetical protein
VNDNESHSQGAQTQPRAARNAKPIDLSNLSGRLAFSPREAGAIIGKSATYIYRQFYAGRLKPISDSGRLMISRGELDRFLNRGAEYDPKPKPKAEPMPETEHQETGQPS